MKMIKQADLTKDVQVVRHSNDVRAIQFTDETFDELYQRGLVAQDEYKSIYLFTRYIFHPFYGTSLSEYKQIQKGDWIVYEKNVSGENEVVTMSDDDFHLFYKKI